MTRRIVIRAAALLAAAALIPACGGKSGGAQATSGGWRILARGGTGTAGNGGSGSDIVIGQDSVGGSNESYTTGSVNAAVTIPAVTPSLGSNPRTVTSNETWTVGSELTQDASTFQGDLAGTATGLWVKPGVTLTIRPNFNSDVDPLTNETVGLTLADGVLIEGTLATATKDLAAIGDGLREDSADLWITATNVVVAAGGHIDTSGKPSPTTVYGSLAGYIDIGCSGTLINRGTIVSAGGSDDYGGDGGSISLYTGSYCIFNGGTVDSSGGTGSANDAGSAGPITASTSGSAKGGIFNNGLILARGGSGATLGGDGGDIDVYAGDVGAVASADTIDASGGSCTVSGAGGTAGGVYVEVENGSLRLAGRVLARGGAGGPAGGDGGDGNDVWPSVSGATGNIATYGVPEGVFVGADIDASGGDGANGGDSGGVYLDLDNWIWPNGYARPVGFLLVGYSVFDASGGDGAVNGGSGSGYGWVEIEHCLDSYTGRYYGGRMYNEVPWVLRGGRGGTGSGGNGTDMYFLHWQPSENVEPNGGLTNVAPIDTSGGDGAINGGDAGGIWLYNETAYAVGATVGIFNSGALTARGGDGAAGNGGDGGSEVGFYQSRSYDYPDAARSGVDNFGAIDCRGGSGALTGGMGGNPVMEGDYWIRNFAPIDCRGGDGGTSGGDATSCDFYLTDNKSSVNVDLMEIVNTEEILASGGNGGQFGGDGGDFTWRSVGRIVNSGALAAGGGTGTASGGGGGACSLRSDTALTNRASIDTSGGAGGTAVGGAAGSILLGSKTTTNSLSLTARGGDSVSGTGGNANTIGVLSTEGNSALSGSSLDVSGGAGATAGARSFITIDGVALDASTVSY